MGLLGASPKLVTPTSSGLWRDTEPVENAAAQAADLLEAAVARPRPDDRPMSGFVFWKFVHNTLIHPALGLCGPWNGPGWLLAAHDWTAERCRGAG